MASVEKTIEVDVPVDVAYNQWTQFESFPQFMEGVKEVRQLDATRLMWHVEVGGKDMQYEAKITEQVPDQVIAWDSREGHPAQGGQVRFQPMGPDRCRIDLRLDYDPQGIAETVGDKLGFTSMRVQGDLERFKNFVENNQRATGAYRGEIHGGQEQAGR